MDGGYGSSGGSGGGGPVNICEWYEVIPSYYGCGGSDGSDGNVGCQSGTVGPGGGIIPGDLIPGGKGQGTTTRAFGESEGTLYAGGGGGNGSGEGGHTMSGGSGGGGRGHFYLKNSDISLTTLSENGAANTGGGAGYGMSSVDSISGGGSGIAIIRWGY